MKISRFIHLKVILCFVVLIILSGFWWSGRNNQSLSQYKCPSERIKEDSLVPNVIHFVHFDAKIFPFVSFVCILSAFINQNPDEIVVHTNIEQEYFDAQPRWKKLVKHIGKRLRLHQVDKPTHVYGQLISNVYHANDVFKINYALQHGGIFLDQDSFVVKSLDQFRKYELTLGWPEGQNIGIQCILAKPGARFLKAWLESYKDYRPAMWYYNAGEYPTSHILKHCPNLVHREKELLGVHNLAPQLYESKWPNWREFYVIHLLFRHRDYLAKSDVKTSGILNFDEDNIQTYNRTFGEMARSVLEQLDET